MSASEFIPVDWILSRMNPDNSGTLTDNQRFADTTDVITTSQLRCRLKWAVMENFPNDRTFAERVRAAKSGSIQIDVKRAAIPQRHAHKVQRSRPINSHDTCQQRIEKDKEQG